MLSFDVDASLLSLDAVVDAAVGGGVVVPAVSGFVSLVSTGSAVRA